MLEGVSYSAHSKIQNDKLYSFNCGTLLDAMDQFYTTSLNFIASGKLIVSSVFLQTATTCTRNNLAPCTFNEVTYILHNIHIQSQVVILMEHKDHNA